MGSSSAYVLAEGCGEWVGDGLDKCTDIMRALVRVMACVGVGTWYCHDHWHHEVEIQ